MEKQNLNKKIKQKAFAVYSETDRSLCFYRREYIPKKYDLFEGKEVTNLYENIEELNCCTEYQIPWYMVNKSIEIVIFEDSIMPISISHWFNGMSSLKKIYMQKLDTSKVISMDSVFCGCENLTSLDVSNFDTSNVLLMTQMFSLCKKITSLDVSRFDTHNVITMSHMFDGCENLRSLDISNFKIRNVSSMACMFQNCYQLQKWM
jgi:surface protein